MWSDGAPSVHMAGRRGMWTCWSGGWLLQGKVWLVLLPSSKLPAPVAR
jgi:hypothetical protein